MCRLSVRSRVTKCYNVSHLGLVGQDERNVVWDRAERGRREWIEPDAWYPAKTTSPLGGARRALCPEADVVKYYNGGIAVLSPEDPVSCQGA